MQVFFDLDDKRPMFKRLALFPVVERVKRDANHTSELLAFDVFDGNNYMGRVTLDGMSMAALVEAGFRPEDRERPLKTVKPPVFRELTETIDPDV